jgi:hypothetical protein
MRQKLLKAAMKPVSLGATHLFRTPCSVARDALGSFPSQHVVTRIRLFHPSIRQADRVRTNFSGCADFISLFDFVIIAVWLLQSLWNALRCASLLVL